MIPIALAGPAVEPIPLADMKAYLRLDGADEDDLVSALIIAGRLTVERHARIALIEQSWRLRLPAWPPDRVVLLPLLPVIGVDAVRVIGPPGPPVAVEPGLYRLDSSGDPARLLVDPTVPEPGSPSGAVEVDVTCGYGAIPAAVPEPLRLAIRRLVAHWFERRGDDQLPAAPGLPADARSLLAAFVRPRLA